MSNVSAEWPANAVPEHWVTALFEKMANSYGNRFLDMWRGVDMAGVRREWGVALGRLSSEEMRAGVGALWTCKYPPTLSEFVLLCKQTRAGDPTSSAHQLTDQTRASPETVQRNMAVVSKFAKRWTEAKEPTAEWAFKLLLRGLSRSGHTLPPEVRRVATGAILSSAGHKFMRNATPAERLLYGDVYKNACNAAQAGENHGA